MAEDHRAIEAGQLSRAPPEVAERQRAVKKQATRKESATGRCRMRWEVPGVGRSQVLHEAPATPSTAERQEFNRKLCPLQQRRKRS